MYRQVVVCCVTVVGLLLTGDLAKAAIVEVDVTIKSVDAKARGITVAYQTSTGEKSIDLDVSRKAEINVNGQAGTLDAVKPGQKAKVSYEKELQVVTQINASGSTSANVDPFGSGTERPVSSLRSSAVSTTPKAVANEDNSDECVRLSLALLESGECQLKVEETATPIASATKIEGEVAKLPHLPNADVSKCADGQIRIIHSFGRPDQLGSIFDSTDGVELDDFTRTLCFRAKRDSEYWSRVQLPVFVCCDTNRFSESSHYQVRVKNMKWGVMAVTLSGLDRGSADRVRLGVMWADMTKSAFTKRKLLDDVECNLKEGFRTKFRLPLPNTQIEDAFSILLRGDKVELKRLLVQGQLRPLLGIKFSERNSLVFAERVLPNGFADKSGLKTGDVILAIDGRQPKSSDQAEELSGKACLGEKVLLKIRRGNKEQEVSVAVE